MTQAMTDFLAKVNYEAFYSNRQVAYPQFETLLSDHREAWAAGAHAVESYVLERQRAEKEED